MGGRGALETAGDFRRGYGPGTELSDGVYSCAASFAAQARGDVQDAEGTEKGSRRKRWGGMWVESKKAGFTRRRGGEEDRGKASRHRLRSLGGSALSA